MTITPDAPAQTAELTDHERALAIIARNPLVKIVDHTDAGEAATAPARSFKEHKARATVVAQDLSSGSFFTHIEAGGKGYWVTEWTVIGHGTERSVARRRAATAKTVLAAVEEMHQHPSVHNAHYYRPEEGLLGRWRRL